MTKPGTKREILTLEDALSALEKKRKEVTRLNNQIKHYKALVEDLTRRLTPKPQ